MSALTFRMKPHTLLWWAAIPLCIVIVLAGCNRSAADDDDKPAGAQKKATTTGASTKPAGDADEGQKVKLTAEAIERFGVKIEKAQKHVLVPTFIAPARVAYDAEAIARVGSAVNGRAVELKARVGDKVHRGDALLTIESSELGEAQSDLLQKRTLLDAATIAVEPAKASYERAKSLYDRQGVSLGELQKREAEYKSAQAAQQTARGAEEAAERKLALWGMNTQAIDALVRSGQINPRYVVRAPIGGEVIERNVTLGQLVGPTNDALLIVVDLSTLWVLADVPEARLQGVSIGSSARVRVPAGATAIPGTVAFIAPSLDPATRSAQVRIEVKTGGQSPATSLKPGMFAEAEIESASEKDKTRQVLAIPEGALQTVNGQPCVFVADDDEPNTFNLRPVAVGQEVNGLIPVISGLKEKEEVVTSGAFILRAELAKSALKDND